MKKPVSARTLKKQKQLMKKNTYDHGYESRDITIKEIEGLKVELAHIVHTNQEQIKNEIEGLNNRLENLERVAELQSIVFKDTVSELNLEMKNVIKVHKNQINELKKSIQEEISTFKTYYLKSKEILDIERTISFQLGKEIINSSKSIKQMINLPKKIMDIREENKRRKDNQLNKAVLRNSEVNPILKKNVITLRDLNHRHQLVEIFNGDLRKKLGLKFHPEINVLFQKQIFINVGSELSTARYFSSQELIKVEELSNYLNEKNEVKFSSLVNSDGLQLDFIVSFYGVDGSKLNSRVLKPGNDIYIKIDLNAKYVGFGVKISKFGSAVIENVCLHKLSLDIEDELKNNIEECSLSLEDGVSVIIPSYRGEKTIIDTLKSIANQKNINLEQLEIIIVLNGELDNTEKLIQEFMLENVSIKLKYTIATERGVSNARNLGIELSTKKYTIFLDDDDMISTDYISSLYTIVDEDSLSIAYIHDLNVDGSIEIDNYLNIEIQKSTINPTLDSCSAAITLIACKMLPTKKLKQIKFSKKLRSGEDVAYFVKYVELFEPKIKVTHNKNAYYIRRISDLSVSRQPITYDFNVIQRLDVIAEISNSLSYVTPFALSKIKSQINFIVTYLNNHPEEVDEVLKDITIRKINEFPFDFFWERLGRGQADQLVLSYCHAPFVDTSAVIVAKRINQFGLISDVIANDMSKHRGLDIDLLHINNHYLKNVYFTTTITSFGGWSAIKDYALAAIETAKNKNYKQLYSRVLWPASNFAAALYKSKNTNVKWVAEFSDPVVLDIEGNERQSILDDLDFINSIIDLKGKEFEFLTQEKNLYVWCEILTYLMADEIIFTCENQRKLMLEKFKYPEISLLAYSKSIIMPHPTPDQVLYEIETSDYALDNNFINIGYFGVFYKNRKIDDLVSMLINGGNGLNVRIHLFTHNIDEVAKELNEIGVGSYFIVNSYVSYFEFLNICTKMDVLIVNDSKVSDIFGFNPYLPSKISDYLGSGTPIWAFCESGSSLSLIKSIDFVYFIDSKYGADLEQVVDTIQGFKNTI